jgi:transcriptional regulator with XRE-family HTH domain
MSSTTLPTPPAIPAAKTVGAMLREWRQRRGLSQLGLACDADVSTRHLSFVETGRAAPSRSLLMHLAEQLAIPLRERNALLVTAGYAPVFPERGLEDPALAAAHAVVARLLEAQAPFPALAVDRQWTLVNANAMARRLLTEGASPALLAPPVNVMRLALHPEGLAPRIANLPEWRAHLLERLAQQAASTADRGARAAARGIARLSRTRQAGARAGRERDRGATAAARGERHAVAADDDDRIRHADRHHAVRTRNRAVLSGGRRDRRGAAGDGGRAVGGAHPPPVWWRGK